MCIKVIGIDLSGPSNTADTVCVICEAESAGLRVVDCVCDAADQDVVAILTVLEPCQDVAIGLDAPLSYQPGGGDRDSDKYLRQTLVRAGLPSGSVMTPTMTRMAYLIRGMGVARLIAAAGGNHVRVAEVHPGGSMALGGAPLDAVRNYKTDGEARRILLTWLEGQGMHGVARQDPSDHYVAACACALAAWKWVRGCSAWLWPARVPHHPYDFAC